MQAKDAVGRHGENVATRYVQDAGWRVLDRNWRGPDGELDIVAMDGGSLVAVEVKTRRGVGYGHPAEAVTPRKVARLRRLTAQWVAAHDVRPRSIRIDVIAVVLPRSGAAQVEHLVGIV